jgi:hypothetical protein
VDGGHAGTTWRPDGWGIHGATLAPEACGID